MKKQKYNLDILEQEIGNAIDNSTDGTTPQEPMFLNDVPSAVDTPMVPTEETTAEKEKIIMKNIWIPESVDCQIKLIRAVRQRQRLPHKFTDIANEALVEYIQHHLNEELQSSSE